MRYGMRRQDIPLLNCSLLHQQDILRSLPGITSSNYWKVMRRVRNLRSLMEMTLEELTNLLGPESAGKLHEFIHQTGP